MHFAKLSAEMVIMAKRVDLNLVAYFLSMAHAEAEDAVERATHRKSARSEDTNRP